MLVRDTPEFAYIPYKCVCVSVFMYMYIFSSFVLFVVVSTWAWTEMCSFQSHFLFSVGFKAQRSFAVWLFFPGRATCALNTMYSVSHGYFLVLGLKLSALLLCDCFLLCVQRYMSPLRIWCKWLIIIFFFYFACMHTSITMMHKIIYRENVKTQHSSVFPQHNTSW